MKRSALTQKNLITYTKPFTAETVPPSQRKKNVDNYVRAFYFVVY